MSGGLKSHKSGDLSISSPVSKPGGPTTGDLSASQVQWSHHFLVWWTQVQRSQNKTGGPMSDSLSTPMTGDLSTSKYSGLSVSKSGGPKSRSLKSPKSSRARGHKSSGLNDSKPGDKSGSLSAAANFCDYTCLSVMFLFLLYLKEIVRVRDWRGIIYINVHCN